MDISAEHLRIAKLMVYKSIRSSGKLPTGEELAAKLAKRREYGVTVRDQVLRSMVSDHDYFGSTDMPEEVLDAVEAVWSAAKTSAVEGLKAKEDDLSQERQRLAEREKELREKISSLESRNGLLEQANETSNKRIEEMRKESADDAKLLRQKENELSSLNVELKVAQSAVSELKSSLSKQKEAHSEQLAELRTQLADAHAEHRSAIDVLNKRLDNSVAHYEQSLVIKVKEIDALKAQVQDGFDERERQLKQKDTLVELARKEAREQQTELARLSGAFESQQSHITAIESHNAELKNANAALTDKLAKLQEELRENAFERTLEERVMKMFSGRQGAGLEGSQADKKIQKRSYSKKEASDD